MPGMAGVTVPAALGGLLVPPGPRWSTVRAVKPRHLGAAAALLILAAAVGCSHPSAGSSPSASGSMVWPETNTPTASFGSPKQAAQALYQAWRDGDHGKALDVAELPAAVALFYGCHGLRPACEKATFGGCMPTGYLYACTFSVPVPPRYLGFYITMRVSKTHGGYRVFEATAAYQGD